MQPDITLKPPRIIEQSHFSEANSFSASQKISPILWQPKIHFRIHESPTPVPIWARSALLTYPIPILRTHFNIILPSTPRFSKRSLSLSFPHENPVCIFLSPLRATCPSHLLPFHYIRYLSCPSRFKTRFDLIGRR